MDCPPCPSRRAFLNVSLGVGFVINDKCKLANIPLKQLGGRGKQHPWLIHLDSLPSVVLRLLSFADVLVFCFSPAGFTPSHGSPLDISLPSTVLGTSCYWPEMGHSGSVAQEGNTNVSGSFIFTSMQEPKSHMQTRSLHNLFLKMTSKIWRVFYFSFV